MWVICTVYKHVILLCSSVCDSYCLPHTDKTEVVRVGAGSDGGDQEAGEEDEFCEDLLRTGEGEVGCGWYLIITNNSLHCAVDLCWARHE